MHYKVRGARFSGDTCMQARNSGICVTDSTSAITRMLFYSATVDCSKTRATSKLMNLIVKASTVSPVFSIRHAGWQAKKG